jgi:outer membrane lipoprotein SlyB
MLGDRLVAPRLAALVLVVIAALAVSACAPVRGGDVYRRGETLRAQSVELGVVEQARPVRIEGPDTGVGTVGGAALGGIAGSTVGRGSGSVAAAIGGAILGGIAGNAIERDANARNGVELTVRLDNGRMLAVVQQDVGEVFRPGDRVRVLSDGRHTRVTR